MVDPFPGTLANGSFQVGSLAKVYYQVGIFVKKRNQLSCDNKTQHAFGTEELYII